MMAYNIYFLYKERIYSPFLLPEEALKTEWVRELCEFAKAEKEERETTIANYNNSMSFGVHYIGDGPKVDMSAVRDTRVFLVNTDYRWEVFWAYDFSKLIKSVNEFKKAIYSFFDMGPIPGTTWSLSYSNFDILLSLMVFENDYGFKLRDSFPYRKAGNFDVLDFFMNPNLINRLDRYRSELENNPGYRKSI